MSEFRDALIAASPVFLGMGAQLSGRAPQGIAMGLAQMNEQMERTKRKAAIDGLISEMGIAGPKAAILSQMPADMQTQALWGMMNPAPVQGKVIDGRLVNPYSGEVMGDFRPETMSTADFLKHLEGFSDTPYWDVNAHRIGYGSDTVTLEDGSIIPVRPGMTVTQEDATRDLNRRIQTEFMPIAQKAAGDAWGTLTQAQQSALTSIAYNYGEIPDRIKADVASGDPKRIEMAILSLQGDNGGVNARRRAAEASTFRTAQNTEDLERLLLNPNLTPEQRDYLERKIERAQPVEPADEYERYRRDVLAEGGIPLDRISYKQAIKGQGFTMTMPDGTKVQMGGGRDAKPLKTTEGEKSAAGYLSRMRAAEGLMDELAEEGPAVRSITSLLVAGTDFEGLALSDRQLKILQAQRDWVRAKLRKESGAVIGVDEMAEEVRTYFPLPGEGPEIIEQKRQARLQAERQMEIMGGGAVEERPQEDSKISMDDILSETPPMHFSDEDKGLWIHMKPEERAVILRSYQ